MLPSSLGILNRSFYTANIRLNENYIESISRAKVLLESSVSLLEDLINLVSQEVSNRNINRSSARSINNKLNCALRLDRISFTNLTKILDSYPQDGTRDESLISTISRYHDSALRRVRASIECKREAKERMQRAGLL